MGSVLGQASNFFLPSTKVVCKGYVFTPVCDSVNRVACVAREGHVWLGRGMHGEGGACMVKEACMAKGRHGWQRVHGKGGHAW